MLRATAIRPKRVELGDDALAEHVAGVRECEGSVRVQALERARAARAADAELERCAAVAARFSRCELAADGALVVVRLRAARGELGIVVRGFTPALDAAGCFETGDGCDEVAAGDVVRRRERLAAGVVRLLLRYGRA